MENKEKLDVLGSPAVLAHISMLQGIINKMSGNCTNCKTWTVTVVAALMVLLVDKDVLIPHHWICLIPVVLFYFLDCFYLGMERLCISAQKKFLDDVAKENYIDKLYKVEGVSGAKLRLLSTINATISFSTTPFYLFVAIIVLFFGR